MSNMPDDYRSGTLERLYAGADEVCPVAYEDVTMAQDAYRKALAYIVGLLKENRCPATAHEIEGMMQGVGEQFAEELKSRVEELYEAGFDMSVYPDDYKQLCEKAAEDVSAAIRPKPADLMGTLREMSLRPVVTNPATPGFGGKEGV
jgi:hypothetical protein